MPKGTLKVENGNLQFVHGKTNVDITAASIQDVVTGDDTQRSVGGTVGVMSMAAPVRRWAVLESIPQEKRYAHRSAPAMWTGAYTAQSSRCPVGAANAIKTQLVSEGAHATPAGEPTTAAFLQ